MASQDRPDYSSNVRFIAQDIDISITREWHAEKGNIRTWLFWELLDAGTSISRDVYTVPEGKFLLAGDAQFASTFISRFWWRAFPLLSIAMSYLPANESHTATLTIPVLIDAGRIVQQFADNLDTVSGYYYMQLTVIAPLGFSKKLEDCKDPLEYYHKGDWNYCEVRTEKRGVSKILLSKVRDPIYLELEVRNFGQKGELLTKAKEHKMKPPPVF